MRLANLPLGIAISVLAFYGLASTSLAQESGCIAICKATFDFASTMLVDPQKGLIKLLGEQRAAFCHQTLAQDYRPSSEAESNAGIIELSKDTQSCDWPDEGPSRVFGGIDAGRELRQNVVRIAFDNPDGTMGVCTGVFVSIEYILTAGHCSCGVEGSYKIRYQTEPAPIGEGIRLELSGSPKRFSGYDCNIANTAAAPPQIGRDLALLHIDKDQLAHPNAPSKIAVASLVGLGRSGIPLRLAIVGYGYTETGELPQRLKYGYSTVRDAFCSRGYYQLSVCAMFREFVMGASVAETDTLGVDSCGGDSGGPVFFIRETDDGFETVLIGVTSRSLAGVAQDPRLICGGGGVYTAVGSAAVLDWLEEFGIHFRPT